MIADKAAERLFKRLFGPRSVTVFEQEPERVEYFIGVCRWAPNWKMQHRCYVGILTERERKALQRHFFRHYLYHDGYRDIMVSPHFANDALQRLNYSDLIEEIDCEWKEPVSGLQYQDRESVKR